MMIFTFLAIPVFSFFVFQFSNQNRRKRSLKAGPVLKGVLWQVIVMILQYILYRATPSSYKVGNLFFHFFLSEHLLYLVLAIGGFFLFFGFYHTHKSENKFIQALSFFTGFFATSMIFYYLINYNSFDFNVVFMLPLYRCITLFLTALFLEKFYEAFGLSRLIYIGYILLIPLTLSFLEVLYTTQYTGLAFFLTILLLGVSFIIFQVVKDL